MKTQQPIVAEEEHRVLKFRPRTLAHPPAGRADPAENADQAPNDLSRYERAGYAKDLHQKDSHEPDDFRHRMLANVAALAFTVALTAIGIWLAMSIADLRKTQDCVLMGRRDCAQISTPRS